MSKFDAKQANQRANDFGSGELHVIIMNIKKKANNGYFTLNINKPLSPTTIIELKSRGFKVIDYPSIAQQKDGLYHTVYWD